MLNVLDYLMSALHLTVVLANTFLWIIPKFRKAHLTLAAITLASWIGGGAFWGWGYCFLTDWQWQIKKQLGETNLPSNFISLILEKTFGIIWDNEATTLTIALVFFTSVSISLWLTVRDIRKK